MTWRDYAAQVRRFAAGLAGLGVRRGDTVSLMMANRIEFYPLDVGAQHVGATSFSVYNTLPAEQLTYVFDNAGTKVVICEQQYVDRVRASGVPIEHIVCVDGAPRHALADGFVRGRLRRLLRLRVDVACRTTRGHCHPHLHVRHNGKPQGCGDDPRQPAVRGYAIDEVLGIRFGDRVTSFLPSAHIADRMTGLYLQEMFGTQVTAVADARTIAAALPDVRPTVWGPFPGLGKA